MEAAAAEPALGALRPALREGGEAALEGRQIGRAHV